MPFAKFISKKKIIADLLGSLYDAEVNSHCPSFWKKLKAKLVDFMAVRFADIILLESVAQKIFFEKRFGVPEKYRVVYTGVDEKFHRKVHTNIKKGAKFIVLFRGKLTPECGIMHILRAAEILKNNRNIFFRIVGFGYFLKVAEKFINKRKLANVGLISRYLSEDELISEIENVNLMLGQFENNPRLNRTIPHKAFEAFALGIPYLTGEVSAIREIVEDGVNAFFVPLADPVAIARKIESLAKQLELLGQVATRARKIFEEKFAPEPLAERLLKIML